MEILIEDASLSTQEAAKQVAGKVAEQQGDVVSFLSSRYKVSELKELCRTFALPMSGRKAQLAERIAGKATELYQVMRGGARGREKLGRLREIMMKSCKTRRKMMKTMMKKHLKAWPTPGHNSEPGGLGAVATSAAKRPPEVAKAMAMAGRFR